MSDSDQYPIPGALMAAGGVVNAHPITVQVEDEIEGYRIETSDYFFSKIGEAVPLMSNGSPFDINSVPAKPLVISNRFHLIFAAHTSGFCVAKIQDVIASAKEIKDKGDGPSVRGSSFLDVPIGQVNILSLSPDSSYLAVVVGQEIHRFSVNSLSRKNQEPIFSSSVESNYVKDLLWTKDIEASIIVLTNNGKIYVGALNKPFKCVMDETDVVESSPDGALLAVVRKNILSIFSTTFEEIMQILLPLNSWIGDGAATCLVKVDSVRWLRSDSIVLGCLQQTEDGTEENYFVQVIMSEDGKILGGSSKLSAVCFNDLFPGIVDDIVPFGRGPHLFVKYLEHCGLGFVSNRKNTDQHIMLFAWSPENNRVSVVDIERDNWLPRIELQENGDENLVLGLCIDETSSYENVKVNIGVDEQKELPPHCMLVCLTLEGKLIMFNVASVAGSQGSSLAFSAASNYAENIPVLGTSDMGGPHLLLKEERTKESALCSGPYDLDAKKIGIRLDEIPVKDDLNLSDMNKYFSFPNSGENLRKESISGNCKGKALVDVETSMPLEHPGHFSQETSNQFLSKNSPVEVSSVVSDIAGTEKLKNERHVYLTDQPLGKTTDDTDVSIAEKIGCGFSQSTPSTAVSSNVSTISGLCNTRTPIFTPSNTKSSSSRSVLTPTNTANTTGSFLGNLSYQSDSFKPSLGKGTNQSKTAGSNGVTEAAFGASSLKMQSQEGVALQKSISQSHLGKLNHKISSLSGQQNTEQRLSKQFCNVQHMVDELDKLLECIEEAGGFRDFCTTAHKSSLETLEEGMDSLSERNRVWQDFTEKQLGEIQLLLDKTVQVLARKTHIEGIIRQTTERQYWELWNRQKLSSELDLKRQNLLNLSQDLINQMIGLEKHFNALELNLFGKSGGIKVSQPLQYKHTPPRYIQSLHTIHNSMMSQLATAHQLSEFLARQMDVLSIRSPPAQKECVKKQLFESIGISCPGDYLGSPDIGNVIDYSSNKKLLVSCSDYNEPKRNQFSGRSNHDPETARRRRDSLDRNWAKFEAPKTTVKRILAENQHQNVSPYKLEGAAGCMGTPKRSHSEALASSMFKWAGAIPEMSKAEAAGSPRLQVVQGSSFSAIQNISALSSPSSSSVDLNVKGNNQSITERSGTQVGQIDKSESALSKDFKPFASQFGHDKSLEPQLLLSPVKSSVMPISNSKEIASSTSVGRSSLVVSTPDALVLSTSGSPHVSTSSCTASSSPTQMLTLPVTSLQHGSVTSFKVVKDGNNQVSQPASSSISVSPSLAHVNSFSTKSSSIIDSHFVGSTTNLADEPPNNGPQLPANEVGAKISLAFTPQPPQNFETSASDGLKFGSTRSSAPSREVASRSPCDLSGTVTLASNMVSITQPEKASAAYRLPPASLTDSGDTTGRKNAINVAVAQVDEMEEEAPETHQTADFSLGSLAGFGLGSVPSATTSSSNPFGGSITGASINMSSSASLTVPSGEFFRPASFSFQSLHASQQCQPTFDSGNSSGSGFGQPGKIGLGQQALGSVLGSFGQSRQLGSLVPGNGFGSSGGGFQNPATGGGFASIGNTASGFAGAAATGGGFAALATSVPGFTGAATGAGGYGAFSKQPNSGISTLGSGAGSRPPPSELFTQIRK